MITAERLKTILAGFPHLTIGLVGDLFLDRYLEIPDEVREMSIETGLEAYQIARVRNQPGALGTVTVDYKKYGVGLAFTLAAALLVSAFANIEAGCSTASRFLLQFHR